MRLVPILIYLKISLELYAKDSGNKKKYIY